MSTPDRLGYLLPSTAVQRGVFLPRYYDPLITAELAALKASHRLITVGQLIDDGYLTASTGDEIGKMAYGTGTIPFVRTSDVSNWELKTDPKQGVNTDIFDEYATAQDVKPGDIFFVRDGTYLIGQTALVTESDLPLLYQSHILKLRLQPGAPLSAPLLLALLNAPIVKRQIRAKQFTADIIDTIGDRYRELVLPSPRDPRVAKRITLEVQQLTTERSHLRDKIRKIPYWIEGLITSLDEPLSIDERDDATDAGNPGFTRSLSALQLDIFIPKYYDPVLDEDLKRLKRTHELVTIAQLIHTNVLSWATGIEVGKMAYGTGTIPFIRTSDIANWELKGDPKQAVSDEIYADNKQDVRAGDILLVRDGTYLVGSSCILTAEDTKSLYCGGLYKFRSEKPEKLDPFLLLAILNMPIVRRQMRAKQFTRDIIDTLGKRIFEVLLPIPRDAKHRAAITSETKNLIVTRAKLRDRTKAIAREVEETST
jgi:hypothetical protein